MYAATVLLSLGLLASAAPAKNLEPSEGVYSIPLRRIRNQAAYGVDLMMGNPPHTVTVLADTGSSTFSVESPGDDVCQKGLCEEFGSFDNETSSTSTYSGSGFTNGVSDNGYGSYLNDTVRVGDDLFPDLRFGYVEEHHASHPLNGQVVAIFGLGAFCVTRKCDATETFVQALYNRGFISRRAFSLYLGPNDPEATGTLLIGGIDEAKRQGPVYRRDMRDPLSDGALKHPNQVQVLSYSLDRADGTSFEFAYPETQTSHHLWDSGSPRWYMPEDLFWEVAAYFGLPATIDKFEAHYEVDCKHREPSRDALTVSMTDGASIPIPMHTLVTKAGDACSIDIGPWDGAMGDPFLRGLYVTFDYDDLTVEFAQVKHTSETNIVRIE